MPADSTTDLKTTENKLSTWLIETTATCDEAALILATGRQKVEAMHIVALDYEDVKNSGLDIDVTLIQKITSEVVGGNR